LPESKKLPGIRLRPLRLTQGGVFTLRPSLVLTSMAGTADDDHLRDACGTFRDEARNVDPTYTPKTVNTDGWKATQNAWRSLFPLAAVILCYLHGFLKIRDRIRKDHELHRRIWDVYRAATCTDTKPRRNVACEAGLCCSTSAPMLPAVATPTPIKVRPTGFTIKSTRPTGFTIYRSPPRRQGTDSPPRKR
jgi:hypothetical protein